MVIVVTAAIGEANAKYQLVSGGKALVQSATAAMRLVNGDGGL